MELARYMVSGCDPGLNTPQKPLEAPGTSGMKASLNASYSNTQRMLNQYVVNAYLAGG